MAPLSQRGEDGRGARQGKLPRKPLGTRAAGRASPGCRAMACSSRCVQMITPFSHRSHAGEVLARSLSRYAGRHDVTVLGIPNGGVPIAFEVARHLAVPLELCFLEPITSPRGDIT